MKPAEPRRVLFLNPVGEIGGAERVLLTLLAGLRATAEFQPGLLLAADGPLAAEAARLGVPTTVVPLPAVAAQVGDSFGVSRLLAWRRLQALPQMVSFMAHLGRAIRIARPDLVHSNGIKTHLLTALLRRRRVPLVWHLHDFLGSRPIVGKLLRIAAWRATAALAVSAAVEADAGTLLRGLPVELVPNGVDCGCFTPGPGDGRWLDGLAGLNPAGKGTVRVGLVATYARWKGQDVFLRAAGQLGPAAGAIPVRFYVVGGPIYATAGSQFSRAELVDLARALGVDAVGFVPYQADTPAVYRALDVVVHASTRPEPFGLTIAEAMACGRAVIVSRAGGAAELFTPEHDGVGVPPGDAAALAAAVGRLCGDAVLRARLGEAARQTALARHDAARLTPRVIEVYRRVLAGAAR